MLPACEIACHLCIHVQQIVDIGLMVVLLAWHIVLIGYDVTTVRHLHRVLYLASALSTQPSGTVLQMAMCRAA